MGREKGGGGGKKKDGSALKLIPAHTRKQYRRRERV